MSTGPIAARARQLAEAAPASSLQRRAAGCAAVVLADARSPKGAQKMLTAAARLDDTVRDAALALIDTLAKETP